MGPGPGKEDDALMWAINKSSIRMGDTQAYCWCRNLVKVTIYRRLLIVRDDRLDQSEAYDIS